MLGVLNLNTEKPRTALHGVADYIADLQGTPIRTYPEDIGQQIGEVYYIKHRRGDMLEEEQHRIRNELSSFGCKYVHVSLDFLGRLHVHLEMDL